MSTYTWIVSINIQLSLGYPQVSHPQIQPTVDKIRYFQLEAGNPRMQRATACTVLHHFTFQDPAVHGGPGTNLQRILKDNCSYVFREWKVTCGFSTAQGSSPIIPALFKCQLCFLCASRPVRFLEISIFFLTELRLNHAYSFVSCSFHSAL